MLDPDVITNCPDSADSLGEVASAAYVAVRSRYAVVIFQGRRGPFTTLNHALALNVRDLLSKIVKSPRDETEIDLWLDTPGGDAHAAYKIALLLRHHARLIRVVIPEYAKSAGTLLSLVGDEIYMSPLAELGPLDAQINYEQEGLSISALDRGRSLQDLIDTALELAVTGGALVLKSTRLSRQESLTAMLDFSAKFMAPIVGKIDPTMLHWSNTILEVAVEYGERLLKSRQVGITPEVSDLPRQLVERYPTHAFVICADEAKELGLPVRLISEYDLEREVLELHGRHAIEPDGSVRVFPIEPRPGPHDK